MNRKVKVSVIIPVYNTEKYLHQCLDTVCAQTLKELQIICVDDGSIDSSVDILKEYAEKDPRVEVLYNKKEGKGAGAARNMGIEHAIGEYLLILDSDDYFELDLAEKAYSKAKLSDADVVLFDATYYGENGRVLRNNTAINRAVVPDKDVFCAMECKETIFLLTPGMAWSKIWRHKFIKDNQILFQENTLADDTFFTHAALSIAKRISVLNERLVNYRYIREGNQTTSKDSDPYSSLDCARELKSFLEGRQLYETFKAIYWLSITSRAFSHLRTLNDFESFKKLFYALKDSIKKELLYDEEWEEIFIQDGMDDFVKIRRLPVIEEIKGIAILEADEYLFEKHKWKAPNVIEFPDNLVKKEDRVVIYGAGDIGRAFFSINMKFRYCEVVGWVDREYEMRGFPVISLDELTKLQFDKILIAIEKESVAESIKLNLIKSGIPAEKIVWQYPYRL